MNSSAIFALVACATALLTSAAPVSAANSFSLGAYEVKVEDTVFRFKLESDTKASTLNTVTGINNFSYTIGGVTTKTEATLLPLGTNFKGSEPLDGPAFGTNNNFFNAVPFPPTGTEPLLDLGGFAFSFEVPMNPSYEYQLFQRASKEFRGCYFELDGTPDCVSVTVTGVPEPATWAMLITGFGLVGSAMRRRRLVADIS